jgi:receptor expression-enhancing protein 5/6
MSTIIAISHWISDVVVVMLKVAYPTYASFKALKTDDERDDTTWLIYWVTLAVYSFVEAYVKPFVEWLPFFVIVRVFVILWLQFPLFNGSVVLFRKYISPFFQENEHTMDMITGEDRQAWKDARKEIGAVYNEILATLVQPRKEENSSPSSEPHE